MRDEDDIRPPGGAGFPAAAPAAGARRLALARHAMVRLALAGIVLLPLAPHTPAGAAEPPLPRGGPAWLGPPAPARPARVVSLAPSLTDTVVALGQTSRLVGVTRYDTAPEVKSIPRVGGFLDPSPEVVLGLRPDLVLWLADGGALPVVRRIADLGVPVLAIPVVGVPDVLRMVRAVGSALGEPAAGERLAAGLEAAVAAAEARAAGRARRRTLLVIGRDPLVVAGPGSWPDALLRIAGGENVVRGDRPWPIYSLERAVADDPDLVIDAAVNEPADAIARLDAIPAVKAGRVVRLPDDRVLRPGPQLPEALSQLQSALAAPAGKAR
jgi:iron complex transport system substrate-binding protein